MPKSRNQRQPSGKQKAGKLTEYRRRRDFSRTTEPHGDTASSGGGRLFIIQKHDARQLHYDLRLELDGTLKSWAVPKGPSLDPKQKILSVLVEDHPIEYGSFEGIIPASEYGAGTVMLWDRGQWEPIGDPQEGFNRGDFKFVLHGEKLRGAWVLVCMKGAGETGKNWLLIKKRDKEARPIESFHVLSERPFSVLTGRKMSQITKGPSAVWTDGRAQGAPVPPTHKRIRHRGLEVGRLPGAVRAKLPDTLKPQLAKSVQEPPRGDDWIHEVKLDGYRMLCRLEQGQARLLTRNGNDWTQLFASVAAAAGRLPLDSAFLDGEVVVLDERGLPDFGALQNATGRPSSTALTYYVFDLPYAQGYDLSQVRLIERK